MMWNWEGLGLLVVGLECIYFLSFGADLVADRSSGLI